jgi:hypothetical protein
MQLWMRGIAPLPNEGGPMTSIQAKFAVFYGTVDERPSGWYWTGAPDDLDEPPKDQSQGHSKPKLTLSSMRYGAGRGGYIDSLRISRRLLWRASPDQRRRVAALGTKNRYPSGSEAPGSHCRPICDREEDPGPQRRRAPHSAAGAAQMTRRPARVGSGSGQLRTCRCVGSGQQCAHSPGFQARRQPCSFHARTASGRADHQRI